MFLLPVGTSPFVKSSNVTEYNVLNRKLSSTPSGLVRVAGRLSGTDGTDCTYTPVIIVVELWIPPGYWPGFYTDPFR